MVPAIIITVGSLVLPDTSNSMIERGQSTEAKDKLKQIRGVDNVDQEFDDLVAASEASKLEEHPWTNSLQRKLSWLLALVLNLELMETPVICPSGMPLLWYFSSASMLLHLLGLGDS
ncbi:hypothetical protein SLEP1_g39677 [Rubroshorea leprosula]|uniref:Uncharacterized protein n=1 Tax=Rubroshorea leprosula TaxID=152421 RepID=A0AAV5L0Y9_9ROSI|nr:hypothetical protein SLEP1_g39677 [Rubroshorea leprosula]